MFFEQNGHFIVPNYSKIVLAGLLKKLMNQCNAPYLSRKTELIGALSESSHSSRCHFYFLSCVSGGVQQHCGHFSQHLLSELKVKGVLINILVLSTHPQYKLSALYRNNISLCCFSISHFFTSVLASFWSLLASSFSMSETEENIWPSASPESRPCSFSWVIVLSTTDWRFTTDVLELLFWTLRKIK